MRQNGVRTMIGGSLYFKLKKKRLHEQRERTKNDRLRSQYDWRKLIPNDNVTVENLGGTYFLPHTPIAMPRKKAAPMDVYGEKSFFSILKYKRIFLFFFLLI